MHVVTGPRTFHAGDVVDPADLNALLLYGSEALADVASKRYAHGILPLQFSKTMATPYDEVLSTEMRTLRFKCPVTCVVERAFLSANMVSSAEVTVDIITGVSTVPAGGTTPWLSTVGALVDDVVSTTGIIASAASTVTAINTNRILLVAGTEYEVVVSTVGAATFDLYRFDVILHVVTDRWQPAGAEAVPAYAPVLLTDADPRDADEVVATAADFAAEVATIAVLAPVPQLYVCHDVVSGTASGFRTFRLPVFDNAQGREPEVVRGQGRIVRVYLFAVMASGAGSDVSAVLKDEYGTTIHTLTLSVAGVTQASGDSGVLDADITDENRSTSLSLQYTLVLANADAAVNALKIYAVVWVSR